MPGPALARLRVELEADSASLETGLQRAQVAFRKIAAVGTAVGTVIAQAFIALAQRVAAALTSVMDVESELFQRLSASGQRAGLLIGRSFERMQEAGTRFIDSIIERVLPGVARLADQIAGMQGLAIAAAAGLEVIVVALKSLVTAGSIVIAVFESLAHIVTAVAKSLMDVGRGDFQAAYDHLSEGARGVANEIRTTARTIQDIWSETAVKTSELGPAVLGPWQTIVRQSSEAADHLRLLRDEMMAALSDPTMAFQDRAAALQVALQSGIITTAKYFENLRKITEIHERAMESGLQSIGSALTALFTKSKPAAIASALINTYVGITQALRSLPPPWSFVQAAAVGAMGFAQVRNITSTSESGGSAAPSVSAPSEASAGVPSQTLTVEGLDPNAIVSGASVRDLAERLLQYQRDGGQVVLA